MHRCHEASLRRFAAAAMPRKAPPILLSAETRRHLERVASDPDSQLQALRARIVLLAAEGRTNADIAKATSLNPAAVGKWRTQFAHSGWSDIGAAAPLQQGISGASAQNAHSSAGGVAHSLSRSGVADAGSHISFIQHLRAHQPVLRWDLSGVCIRPPDRAIVLSATPVRESQSATGQAEPAASGSHPSALTDPDVSAVADALTLLAALTRIDRPGAAPTDPLYRHRDWLQFLDHATRGGSVSTQYHILADRLSRSTQKHWRVRAWLDERPHIAMHLTSGHDWLTATEDVLAELAKGHVAPGSFACVNSAARAASSSYLRLKQHGQPPGHFLWWPPEAS